MKLINKQDDFAFRALNLLNRSLQPFFEPGEIGLVRPLAGEADLNDARVWRLRLTPTARPTMNEMEALAQGALRVLNGEEPAGVYPPAEN